MIHQAFEECLFVYICQSSLYCITLCVLTVTITSLDHNINYLNMVLLNHIENL